MTEPTAGTDEKAAFIDVVFDGPPSHESGRFVEVENEHGQSINAGEWVERGDGLWALRIPRQTESVTVPVADLRRVLYAMDCAATMDGEFLSGSQERSLLSLRRAMKEAGHAVA